MPLEIPAIGVGLWNLFEPQMTGVIGAALREGCRLLDGAAVYENERQVGECVRRATAGTLLPGLGPIPRSELFVTSKVWCTELSREDVRVACRRTLQDLQLDYLDLYLVHWPFALEAADRERDPLRSLRDVRGRAVCAPVPIEETWAAMEALVEEGLVRAIGVSNFNLPRLQSLCARSRVKPALLQIELHPYLPQERLVSFCRENGIAVQAYSPLGSSPAVSSGRRRVIEDPVITGIAAKHGCTPAQVLLGWGLARGASVIPKTSRPERVPQNMHAAALDDDDLRRINSIETRIRYLKPTWAPLDCFEDDQF